MVAARELEDGELEEGEITGDESEQVGPASLLSSACPCQAVQKARSFRSWHCRNSSGSLSFPQSKENPVYINQAQLDTS